MLKTVQKITLNGESIVDGVAIATFTASINSLDPADMTITNCQTNKTGYKANRTQARADQAEFEELAYAKQDEMIAAKGGTTNETQK